MNSFASISHLDRKITNTTSGVTSAYNAGTHTTTWTLPYSVNTDQTTQGHLTIARTDTSVWFEDSAQAVNAGLTVTRPAANQIAVTSVALGNLTAIPVVIGVIYTSSFQLSTIYQRNEKGGVEQRGRLRQGYLNMSTEPMTNATCTVTPQGRSPYTYVFYDPTAQNDAEEIKPWRIPVQCRNEDSTIAFSDSTPGSFRFILYDWEGYLTLRSRGV